MASIAGRLPSPFMKFTLWITTAVHLDTLKVKDFTLIASHAPSQQQRVSHRKGAIIT
jgi:hypothetical protein